MARMYNSKGIEVELDEFEKTAWDWQYHLMGSFHSTLMELISLADEEHLDKIALAFPVEVEAYYRYTKISGWWQNVQKKMFSALLTLN